MRLIKILSDSNPEYYLYKSDICKSKHITQFIITILPTYGFYRENFSDGQPEYYGYYDYDRRVRKWYQHIFVVNESKFYYFL